ncbi:MAG TPA: hypothetical protein VJT73_14460 [Polyangiaceae bacterium]|nr:hypothetical protein [Polyangiaceae bacterium]
MAGSLVVALAGEVRAAGVKGGEVGVARPWVDIAILGPDADARALERSLRELFQRLGLEMRVRERGAGTLAFDKKASIRASVDLRAPESAVVSLSDALTDRALAPRTIERRGSRALFLEEVAHVTHVATESLLAARQEEATPAVTSEVPSPAEAPAPNPPKGEPREDAPRTSLGSVSGGRIDLALLAGGEAFTKDASLGLTLGGGVRVAVSATPHVPAFWFVGKYHLPFGHDELPVVIHARVWSARLVPAWRVSRGKTVFVEVGVGGGADVISLSPGAAEGVTSLRADRTDVSPVATAVVATHVLVDSGTSLFLAANVDWDLTPRAYFMEREPERMALIEPRVLRPGLAVGLSFNVAGSKEAP